MATKSPRPTSPAYAAIYAAVRRIPRGRVATYGDIAREAGLPGRARQVGYALHALPDGTTVPWHRVIDAAGRVRPRATPGADALQAVLLRRERVAFDAQGRVDLARFRWPRRAGKSKPGAAPASRRARIAAPEPRPKPKPAKPPKSALRAPRRPRPRPGADPRPRR